MAAMVEAIAAISVEFNQTYRQYLLQLGHAVRQQFIRSAYYLCTQAYPEAFLGLSFNQRQDLQQNLQKLGQQAQSYLLSQLKDAVSDADELSEIPSKESLETKLDLLLEEQQTDIIPKIIPAAAFRDPDRLEEWQEELEDLISDTLQTLSRDANRLLQSQGILPHQVPEPVLEVAAKAETIHEGVVGPPNLLKLVVEREMAEASDNGSMTPVIALNLRLADIEFADTTLTNSRNQIRSLLSRLALLQREYHKRQREKRVMEAESAWRASWFEEQ